MKVAIRKLVPVLLFLLFALAARAQKSLPAFSQGDERELFPQYRVYGRFLRDVRDFKAGEKAEICEAQDCLYYLVLDRKGRKITVPFDSIETIAPDVSNLPQAKDAEIEAFACENFRTEGCEYLLWTDLARLETYALRSEGGVYRLLRRMPCSAGDETHPTPRGVFEVRYKTKYLGKEDAYLCKWAVSFYKDYLYHSTLFAPDGAQVLDCRLGERISRGCIRLSEPDSRWIYCRLPIGTPVVVR